MTKRLLGPLSLFALGVNGMVGVGIFFAPAEVAASMPGLLGSVVYLATALLLAPIAWAYASLGARFPVDGGPYVWARAAFGETFAFFVGWMTYVSALFSMAAVMSAFGRHAAPSFGIEEATTVRAFALCTLVALSIVSAMGLKPSAQTWTVLTVLKLTPLALLIGAGVLFGVPSAAPLKEAGLDPLRAVLVVVFATQGFEIVPVVAGSAVRAERLIPVATLGALAFVAVLYAAIHTVVIRAAPGVAGSGAPLVDAANALGGSSIGTLVENGANLSALGLGFAMCVMTPRYLAVLGDPRALGFELAREDDSGVPRRALVVTVLIVGVFVLLGERGELFVLSSVAVLAQYGVTVASLAVLAYRRKSGLRRRHLWPVPLSIFGILLAARGANATELVTAAGVLGLGAVLLVARRFHQRAQP